MKNFFIRRPIFAISLSVVIVLLGVISIGSLSIEQYPDITPPVVEVTATYEGADAETVNNAVATPLAESIMGVSDMLYMQATSANDGSMTLQVPSTSAPMPTSLPYLRKIMSLRQWQNSHLRSQSRELLPARQIGRAHV